MTAAARFPEFDEAYPPPTRRKKAEFVMRGSHREVLRCVARRRADDRQIIDAFVGEMRPSTVERLIEDLGRHGYLADTGERTNNRLNGRRCILWEISPKGSAALVKT